MNIVSMVFGNLGDDSGTGVAFTRNPSTGEKKFYGEFLINAQGEDVVAGIRTPLDIDEMAKLLPESYAELRRHGRAIREALPRHAGHRVHRRARTSSISCKRAPANAPRRRRCASPPTWSTKGLIDTDVATLRVAPEQLDQLLHPVIDSGVRATPLCTGLPASPGAASGIAVFDPDVAEQRAAAGEHVILVRDETTPEDFHGIVAARAVLTARGGMTSHAAVVARGMGKCAVVGCKEIHVDIEHRRFSVGEVTIPEGEWITVDGATGNVYRGDLPTTPSEVVQVDSRHARSREPRRRISRSRACSAGRTTCAGCECARMPTRRTTRASRAASAPKESGSAAPSTCSSRATASPRCAR